jgi:hypothetical protein
MPHKELLPTPGSIWLLSDPVLTSGHHQQLEVLVSPNQRINEAHCTRRVNIVV